MWDANSIYPRIESGYAFTKDINDELVEKFINETFSQGSATLKIKYYNPKNLIVQHLPDKERGKKNEINRMRNGYSIDTLNLLIFRKLLKLLEK